MKKNCKKLQRPMLILSAVLFVLFTVLLIVASVAPLGKTYVYSDKMSLSSFGVDAEIKVTQSITLSGDKKGETSAKFSSSSLKKILKEKLGDAYSEDTFDKISKTLSTEVPFTYTESDGKIIIVGGAAGIYEQKGANLVLSDDISFKCTGSTVAQIASAIIMVVSGVAFITIFVFSKKNSSKKA